MNDKDHRFDGYFEKYRTMVIRNAWYYVRDYHAAEEICQETFIRLYGNMDSVPPERVWNWLFLVSERIAKDYRRRMKHTPISLDEYLEEHDEPPARERFDLSDVMVAREGVEHRMSALAKLKSERPQWYEVLVMSCLENMDNHAIGRELGVKAGLVSQWKNRARKRLRDSCREESKEKGS